ncbi:hypothetical protein Q5P01_016989 [Channa striata]|uniref:AIG1-type G domain-containing protein n=1 Tax=Channa striata TaxID=64152 RepID=A0AA88M8S0_CHASR|nr:hypothetical protein Q5P01_016989 [Channa striata]
MVSSLSLCPPGPHVFLLVIRVDRAFTDTYRRAVQEHLQLISDHIYSRVIVLFTFGDWLGDTAVERYIESEGEPLQWLIERCGSKYHVLNNIVKGDKFQVRELIGKIEEMLSGRGSGWHYEIERKVVEELQGKIRREEARAKERLTKKEKQRQMARAKLENLTPLSEMRVVLLGGRKTGKSSCGNTILGRKCFDTDTQTSCCTEKGGRISSSMVTVLDTPGGFLMTSDLLKPSFAILLVVNVSSSFKDNHWKAVEEQLEAGGGQLWSRAVVLFSHGDWLGNTIIEQRIESEGELLHRLVEKCGNRYHVLDNKHRGDGAQVAELIEMIEEMLVEERLAVLHQDDRRWESVSSAQEQQPDTGTHFKQHLSHEHQLPHNLTQPATSSSCPSLNCSDGPGAAGQIVALPAGRAGGRTGRSTPHRHGFISHLAAGGEGLRGITAVNLPIWFSTDHSHGQVIQNSGRDVCPLSPSHTPILLVLPETPHGTPVEGNGLSVRSLCHPAIREQTLRRLAESGGLQALIDQCSGSSLEELEAFIDAYFEMMWEQTIGSFQMSTSDYLRTKQDAAVEEAGKEKVLSSTDRKLSKLELLDEIRNDLAELRESLEHIWKAVQELRERNKQDANDTC